MVYNKRLNENSFDNIELTPFFEHSIDLLCVAGFDGFFKKISPSVSKLLGYSDEELYSKPINDFIFHEDLKRTINIRERLKENTPVINYENRYVKKNGSIVWLHWTSIPIANKKLIYAIAKNITYKKREEESRNHFLMELEKTNQQLKQISATTSHDLRSPVNNLISVFSLMDLSKISDPETLEFIDILKTSTNGLLKTLNTYVDNIGSTYSEKITIEKLDFEEVFYKIYISISTLIQESNTSFEIDFSDAQFIKFNRSYLESIFMNLITNSIKYARESVPPIIIIKTINQIDHTLLVFSDNGIGLDVDIVKDKIFGLNQKFTNHTDSKGIGLYLVKSHITSLGGSIIFDSSLGKGTTFTLTFPN